MIRVMSKKSTVRKKPTRKQTTKKLASVAKKKQSASALPFSVESLGELCDFLKAKEITEFEWSKGDQKIVMKTGNAYAPMMTHFAQAPVAVSSASSATSAQSDGQQPGSQESAEPSSYQRVLSPFVGTFYRSPSPSAPSYVEKGKRVNVGDSLCIVEAMKLMNEIEAECQGTVVEILVENGQPVEFGEPLFVIDTAK